MTHLDDIPRVHVQLLLFGVLYIGCKGSSVHRNLSSGGESDCPDHILWKDDGEKSCQVDRKVAANSLTESVPSGVSGSCLGTGISVFIGG